MTKNTTNKTNTPKEDVKQTYSYYSRVLEKPFDSLVELTAAEQKYFDEKKAKEDAATQKKTDAQKVEAAFKTWNTAKKTYKEKLTQLTTEYSEELTNLKKAYELGKDDLRNTLARAEEDYSRELKNFTDKYPEGYHLTLKDGDFETVISSQTTNDTVKTGFDTERFMDIFNTLFNW